MAPAAVIPSPAEVTDAMVKVGERAPGFELTGDDGARHAMEVGGGRRLVVYFYPKDDTPGCTVEAKDFSASLDAIRALGADVVGISRDTPKRHKGFCDKHALTVRLLSDEDGAAHRAWGAWGTKTLYGRTSEGCIRSTFLVDEAGIVRAVWSPVKVPGHVAAVIDALRGADGEARSEAVKRTTKR